MRTLRILTREHAAIAALIDRFEAEVDRIVALGGADAEAVDRLLLFFETQVDGHHQEKEERVFLPRLLARASGDEERLLRVAIEDHGAQRKLLERMRNQLEGATYGEPNSLAALARGARTYMREQREHACWEQSVLFPLAARILEREDDRTIVDGFRQLDEQWGGLVWEESRAVSEWLDRRGPLQAA